MDKPQNFIVEDYYLWQEFIKKNFSDSRCRKFNLSYSRQDFCNILAEFDNKKRHSNLQKIKPASFDLSDKLSANEKILFPFKSSDNKSADKLDLAYAIQRKLAKNKIEIKSSLDLHGCTQDQAYSMLLRFLQQSQKVGLRYVLVIVGKGRSTGGILKQQVPKWFTSSEMSIYVNAFSFAARKHGDKGALYVRLAKMK